MQVARLFVRTVRDEPSMRAVVRSSQALAFLLLCGCPDPGKLRDGTDWSAIGREIIEMAREDQDVRRELVARLRQSGGASAPDDLARRMAEVDARNIARLKVIVARNGWPAANLVGEQAAGAAWLLVQHADREPEFQADILKRMETLLPSGGVSRRDFALLTDRVLVNRGEPQVYGTQYEAVTIGGIVHFGPKTPIRDAGNLDARRTGMGLSPHDRYVADLREMLGVPDGAPPLPSR